jgi:hypothetical protein
MAPFPFHETERQQKRNRKECSIYCTSCQDKLLPAKILAFVATNLWNTAEAEAILNDF